ncbi:hypothetical protein BGW41_004619 [Actinomortierella wolfii]|nr:hypothetical protein BGW41_004619 [Actinomortierella wolfii]
MTNPEFDFDEGLDISKILQDIDAANEALDSLDVRADALTATLNALLRAQSQANPYGEVSATATETVSMETGVEVEVVEQHALSASVNGGASHQNDDGLQKGQANGTK